MTAPPVTCPADLINPGTPLAYLSPKLAFETQVSNYAVVGSLAAMIWDMLFHINSDYRLLKLKIGIPTCVYFFSRLATFSYILVSAIFQTTPLGDCQAPHMFLTYSYPFAVPSTSLLFFFRIRAIFNGNRSVVYPFFALWLCVLGGCWSTAGAVMVSNISTTKYCINTGVKPYASAAAIIPLVHDTFVFIAISWRLHSTFHIDNIGLKDRAVTLLYGKYLPSFSRTVLQDGQLYYLITVGSNLVTVIMLLVPSIPGTYRIMFTVPNVMLMNAMACHVFRSTKLGHIGNNNINSVTSWQVRGSIPLGDVHRVPLCNDPKETTKKPLAVGVSKSTVVHHDSRPSFDSQSV